MSERIILPVLSLGGVRLEPLDVHHETGLREAVCDGGGLEAGGNVRAPSG